MPPHVVLTVALLVATADARSADQNPTSAVGQLEPAEVAWSYDTGG
jgi:hypothetical protein